MVPLITGEVKFNNRNIRYTGSVVRQGAEVRQDPAEYLKGKRFSIPDCQMPMALWTRSVLQHEFGVFPQDLRCSRRGARPALQPHWR